MAPHSRFLTAFRALLLGNRSECDLSAELQFHLECKIAENLKAGMTPEEARRQALLTFGGMDPIKEACRDQWAFRWMEDLVKDLLLAWRLLVKAPAFSLVVIGTLALGIGANTAIFSLIDALILRKLPVHKPDRLVALSTTSPQGHPSGLSYPMFEEIRRQQKIFSSLFAWSSQLFTLEANGLLWPSEVMFVTGDFYSTLGIVPLIGRAITPYDEGPQGTVPASIAVISYGCWQRQYAGDAAVIGRVIRVEGKPYTIVGVTPKAFLGLMVGVSADVTVPLTSFVPLEKLRKGTSLNFDVMARLKEHVTMEQTRMQLEALWPVVQGVTVPPDWDRMQQKGFLSYRLRVESGASGTGQTMLRVRFSRPLSVLMCVVSLVLLIACVNLASLLLARAAARQREMGVRIALGASHWRLIRQLLTESVLLSITGALPGLCFAWWASRLLANFMWTGIVPLGLNLDPDLRVLGFTAAIAVLTGIGFGLAPARRGARQDPARLLQQSSRTLSGGAGRLGKLLVSTQVASELVLLIGALLFVRSLQNLRSADLGFRSDGVLVMQLNQKPGGYDNLNRKAYYDELIDHLSQLPGVRSVSLSQVMPIVAFDFKESVTATSSGFSAPGPIDGNPYFVSPRFFETLGIPLLTGRDFDPRDNEHAPRVTIVSHGLARKLFPSTDAIGQHISIGTEPEHRDLQIVGVVGDVLPLNMRNCKPLAVYLSYFQQHYNQPFVQVRTMGDPSAMGASIRGQIEGLGREYPLWTRTLIQEEDRLLLPERMMAVLSGCLGILSLLLASIGLYGLMAYTVSRRTAEIGIRLAFGAEPAEILWLALRETLFLVLIGVAIGLPVGLAATRLISSELYGLTPSDPITIAMATSLLVAVAVFAGYLPARRATKVDPMVALRYE